MSWPTQTARIGDVHRQPVPSAWEQAGAVCDRIWDAHPQATICAQRDWDGVAVWVAVDPDAPDEMLCAGTGPTYVAALIDLGRMWGAADA